jgi:hypothetical protein
MDICPTDSGRVECELVAGGPPRPVETVDRDNLLNDLLRAIEFIGRPSGVALIILFGNFSLSTLAIGGDRAPDLSPFPRWSSPTLFLRL